MGKKKPKSRTAKPAIAAPEPSLDMDMIAAAISSANQTVFMKVCRLCESKDGPFLNIFDAEKVTAKKIDELMPFKIAENDDLPHKICFRCSAKVEELYEFLQKCIKTQHSLHSAMGKKETVAIKTKTRTIWEEKLNKSNISNDDICDALIKKAMEGIKDIPLNPALLEEKPTNGSFKKEVKRKVESPPLEEEKESKKETEGHRDTPMKKLKSNSEERNEKFIPKRASRSQNPEALLDGLQDVKRYSKKTNNKKNKPKVKDGAVNKKIKIKFESSDEETSSDSDLRKAPPTQKKEPTPAPIPVEEPKLFNIMDHVSTIKVNGVGVLFQCKLCNRNFLKKEVVITHGCSKTGGVPKVDFTKKILPPEPPKASVVKYINTKVDGELGKPNIDNKTASKAEVEVKMSKEESKPKPKPKIGPASKVKRFENNSSIIGMTVAPIEEPLEAPAPPVSLAKATQPVTTPDAPSSVMPSVEFPSIPNSRHQFCLNSRYKLVPGPNNTFQLVEDGSSAEEAKKTEARNEDTNIKPSKKRKSNEPSKSAESKTRKSSNETSLKNRPSISQVIDLEDPSEEQLPAGTSHGNQPYPVGLFQTLPHHSRVYAPPTGPEPTFTTPAMKKQSYTIVQTGNPSKLLISTKPQPQVEEVQHKKRQKKSKVEVREGADDKQPFHVTLEDSAPPKDSGFFTFINVDPLLQPSYVLPTDNIIQESQISTSTPLSKGNAEKEKEKYSCNMCEEKFSREKKLLAHIQSHYSKMDEEDLQREKGNRKKGKK